MGLESGFFMINTPHGYASVTLWKRWMTYTNTAILIDSSLFLCSSVLQLFLWSLCVHFFFIQENLVGADDVPVLGENCSLLWQSGGDKTLEHQGK
jgi:hypothetical protein